MMEGLGTRLASTLPVFIHTVQEKLGSGALGARLGLVVVVTVPIIGDKEHQSSSFPFPQREFGSGETLVSAAVVP